MALWPVFVEAWQIECCGIPPSVGDDVAWTLDLVDPAEWVLPEAMLVTLEGEATDVTNDYEDWCVVRAAGGLTASIRGQCKSRGRLRAQGFLREDHHAGVPADMPKTRGTVRRVQVVSVRLELHGGVWRPVPGTVELRDVTTSPKWFEDASHRHELSARVERGVLVELDLSNLRAGR